uniref:Transmembrane protein 69 n=1 Tax=Iconisemion striatum TaxID=60296 RepID=A0A1A7XWU7_9TELE
MDNIWGATVEMLPAENHTTKQSAAVSLSVLLRLIPFLSAPLLMAATQTFYPEVAHAQMVYGASIVSFLGGARWGFAIPTGSPAKPDWVNLGNSVVPSLLAWLALLCRDNITEGALVVIMGLGLSLHYDLTLLPGYPNWFRAMRTVLTLVATFSLVATLALKSLL